MMVAIRPDLESVVQERLHGSPFRSLDELVNAAVEQFVGSDFGPEELNGLLDVGAKQATAGQFVEEADVVSRLRALAALRRQRPSADTASRSPHWPVSRRSTASSPTTPTRQWPSV